MKKLVLIDGMSLAFRAYFASETRHFYEIKKNNGVRTLEIESHISKYSIKLFTSFLKQITEREVPDFSIVAWDLTPGSETFRGDLYPEYKGQRGDNFAQDFMFEQMKDFATLYGYNNLGCIGFEADDVIGSAVHNAHLLDDHVKTVVISGDKDFIQLTSKSTEVQILKVGVSEYVSYDDDLVLEEFGVRVDQLVDFKALVGDSSDNYKGVPGIGPVAAKTLLNEFETIDGIYADTDKIKANGMRNKIIAGKDDAYLFQIIADIRKDVPCDFSKDAISHKKYSENTINKKLSELEEKNFIIIE